MLTGDLALIVQLEQENIESRLPFDVIMEAAPNLLMGNMIRIVSPTRQRGMLFGRVIPGNWAGTTAGGKFTVCDMENVDRVYFDNDAREWCFDMPLGESVAVGCQIQQRDAWAVCGSYDLPGNGAEGTITVRAGTDPNNREARTVRTTKEITSPTPGRSSHGSSVLGADFWNGHLRSIVIGPQGMASQAFRNILTIPDAAPNPYDNGMLDRVLQRVGSLNSQPGTRIQLPTESDLKALNF